MPYSSSFLNLDSVVQLLHLVRKLPHSSREKAKLCMLGQLLLPELPLGFKFGLEVFQEGGQEVTVTLQKVPKPISHETENSANFIFGRP